MSRDIFWNTAGSLIYALSSMVLAFFVMRLQGAEEGGIFGFGFSTFGQQMFIVAYFGIRPFQITDVSREYSFLEYRRFRLLTALTAAAASVLYLGFLSVSGAYTGFKALVIGLLAFYKICDGYGDVYESELQRDGKLYLAGQLLSVRTLVCAGAFVLVLLLGGGLFAASLIAVLLQLVFLTVYHGILRRVLLSALKTPIRRGKLRMLFGGTVLLFLSVFLDFYIFSAAKYAVDLRMTDADNGIFNLLFMPTSVIYLAANFIIRPFMTRLAAAFEQRELGEFQRIRRGLSMLILGLTALGVFCALVLGRFVLGICEYLLGASYAGLLTAHTAVFSVIILGGGLYALANLYYYVLVILRQQRTIFFVYGLLAVLALPFSDMAVRHFGLFGAVLVYLGLMVLLCLGFRTMGEIGIRRAFRQGEENTT